MCDSSSISIIIFEKEIKIMYDNKMDPECIPLCNELNVLPGIKTFESCCGHGKNPFRIWFTAENMKDLLIVVMAVNPEYCGQIGYSIQVEHSEYPPKVIFLLEGPITNKIEHNEVIESIHRLTKALKYVT